MAEEETPTVTTPTSEPPVETNINMTDPPTGAEAPETTDESLLAGKFKTPEELEKAYKELESKLGGTKSEETAKPTTEENPTTDTKEITVAGLPATKFFKEFDEKGSLSAESYKELADKGIPKEIVDAYIDGQKARIEQHQDLSEKAVTELVDAVGGQEEFNKMRDWASTTGFTDEEKESYSAAVESGDPRLAKMAIAQMKSKYESAFGHAPNLVEGQVTDGVVSYRSRNEMVAAMKDPRYGSDPAYTKDVERKVAGMK